MANTDLKPLKIETYFISAFVVFCAFCILVKLGIKGYKTKTFKQYYLVYLILITMILVWSLVFRYNNLIYFQPASTFLFAMKYVRTTTEII